MSTTSPVYSNQHTYGQCLHRSASGQKPPRPEGHPKDDLACAPEPSALFVMVSSIECTVGRKRVPARLQPGQAWNLD
jgi:hypothetical protein